MHFNNFKLCADELSHMLYTSAAARWHNKRGEGLFCAYNLSNYTQFWTMKKSNFNTPEHSITSIVALKMDMKRCSGYILRQNY